MAILAPVRIDALPDSMEAFLALQRRLAQTPQGGAAMAVVALLLYVEDRALGERCLALAADPERVDEGPRGPQLTRAQLWLFESQLSRQPYLPRSYLRGTSPAEGYRLPVPPYVLEFSDNRFSGDPETGPYKVYVACSGADRPRPVTVRKGEDGLWRALEWSSLLVGVKGAAEGG